MLHVVAKACAKRTVLNVHFVGMTPNRTYEIPNSEARDVGGVSWPSSISILIKGPGLIAGVWHLEVSQERETAPTLPQIRYRRHIHRMHP